MIKDWQYLVDSAPTRSYQRKSRGKANLLARYVPNTVFKKGTPPSYLYASGNINRCNPAGIRCVYFGEGPATARAEFDSYYTSALTELGYYARVAFRAIIDLGNPDTCSHFGLRDDDFTRSYVPRSGALIPLQEIGLAVSRQHKVTAIRFPSNAMLKIGKLGFNVVVFQDVLKDPDFLEIMEETSVLEKWPKV